MFCKKCGEPIMEDCEYCPICGAEQVIAEGKGEGGQKPGTDGAAKIAGKAAKTVVNVIGDAAVIVATTVGDKFVQKATKSLIKKGNKGAHKLRVKMGLEKKNLTDVAGDLGKILKKTKKRRK